MSKTEPEYPANGWTVNAKPNGELNSNGQTYPYLFWEGKGLGVYPDYHDRGFIVAQSDLVSAIRSQLAKQGLNSKEIADFMDFWQARLPQTPYVRLTWLNTSDMDKLAPLTVSPRPNSTLRIFLEFEGLQNPIALKPQTFYKASRDGFTLVEWGGLLIGK